MTPSKEPIVLVVRNLKDQGRPVEEIAVTKLSTSSPDSLVAGQLDVDLTEVSIHIAATQP